VHRQGKAVRLRVRRQGLDRHHQRLRPGGQFVLQAKALPGNPYDGHTLRAAIETPAPHRTSDRTAYVDKGYRGHDAPKPRSVFISGQKRASSASSSESCGDAPHRALIGHMKEEATRPLLPQGHAAMRKRHPHCRRIQLQAHPRLAQDPLR